VECRREVEAYFDGELDEQTTEMVTQHLSACVDCASIYRKLEDEQGLYLRYECDAEPAPDFWDNVLARAAAENVARSSRPLSLFRGWMGGALGNINALRFSPSLTALLVLVAIGITVGVMRYTNSREERAAAVRVSQNEGVAATTPAPMLAPAPDETVRPANSKEDGGRGEKGNKPDENEQPQLVKNRVGRKDKNPVLAASNEKNVRAGFRPNAPGRKQTSDELVLEAEQKYVAAIAMLSRDVHRRRSRLDPETARRFAQTLSAVDRTIADTRRAARRHPGDPVAAQYMLTAYSKKVDVLREIIGY
jgi:anti-sigma factor RsiW